MVYRYIATSVAGFVQQLAVAYINHGYFFYVAGHIPPGSDADAIDCKLMAKYGVAMSRWQRARRKLLGQANVHYLRCGSFWVLLANHGEHPIFQEEKDVLRDVRREPIAFCGYSISHRLGTDGKGHVSVRIHANEERWLKVFMIQFGRLSTVAEVEQEFARLRFEPYAPVVRQLYGVLRATNKARKVAGLPPVDWKCIRTRRRVIKPFEPVPWTMAA